MDDRSVACGGTTEALSGLRAGSLPAPGTILDLASRLDLVGGLGEPQALFPDEGDVTRWPTLEPGTRAMSHGIKAHRPGSEWLIVEILDGPQAGMHVMVAVERTTSDALAVWRLTDKGQTLISAHAPHLIKAPVLSGGE